MRGVDGMRKEKLAELVHIYELTDEMLDLQLCFIVFDKEGKVLYLHAPTETQSTVEIGEVHNENAQLREVLKTGKSMLSKIPVKFSENYLEAKLLPVKEKGAVVGAMALSYIVKKDTAAEEQFQEEKQKLLMQIQSMERELAKRENRDEMTHLYNRNGLLKKKKEYIKQALRPGYKLMVLVADLNSLKYINDNFGHTKGDESIIALGDILVDAAEGKAECFRIGGDEFEVLAVLPESDLFLSRFIRNIEEGIIRYNEENSLPYSFEASYGYVFETMSYEADFDEYVKIADRRMYAMKQQLKKEHVMMEDDWLADMRNMDYSRDKILIADDDRLMRSVLKSFFRDNEIIVEVKDGQEALERIEKEEFSLICLDIQMPILDGFGVLAKMKEQETKNDAPIIMVTASEDEALEEKGYEEGVADFIKKPFNPVIAKHRIDNVLSLYKKRVQLERLIEEKDVIVKYQAKQLVMQAKKLEAACVE